MPAGAYNSIRYAQPPNINQFYPGTAAVPGIYDYTQAPQHQPPSGPTQPHQQLPPNIQYGGPPEFYLNQPPFHPNHPGLIQPTRNPYQPTVSGQFVQPPRFPNQNFQQQQQPPPNFNPYMHPQQMQSQVGLINTPNGVVRMMGNNYPPIGFNYQVELFNFDNIKYS